MIHIVLEEKYRETTWCERIISGIEQQSKTKKIKFDFKFGDFASDTADAIIVVGTTPAWIYETINLLKSQQHSFIILVSNRPYSLSVSDVCTDLYSAVKNVLRYLEDCGRKYTALYGVNPSSTADNIKLSAFEQKENVYYNFGDLRECRNKFLGDIDKYDAVICTNDYAAVSLINHLEKENPIVLNELFIVGFANTHLGRINKPSVTSVALNYEEYGRTAVDIYCMLKKNPNLHSVNVNVKSDIVVRDTTKNIPVNRIDSEFADSKDKDFKFYDDTEVRQMVKMEKLFENCNESDVTVLSMLANGESYEKTAEKHFMTVNGIKYRLDRLCRICGFESKKRVIEEVRKRFTDTSEIAITKTDDKHE